MTSDTAGRATSCRAGGPVPPQAQTALAAARTATESVHEHRMQMISYAACRRD